MSTNSLIGILNKEKRTVKSIYCHWDGYLEGVGDELATNYKDVDKVRELIELGDLSGLNTNIKPKGLTHTFDKPEDDVCVFYHRDRGEDWEHVKPFECALFDFAHEARKRGAQFAYYFDVEENEWNYCILGYDEFNTLDEGRFV